MHPAPGALLLFAAGLFGIMEVAVLSMAWPKLSDFEFLIMLIGMYLGYEAWRYTFSR